MLSYHPGNRGKQYLKFSWCNFLRQEKQKGRKCFAGVALLPSRRIYSVRDIVRHRMHKCPCAWAEEEQVTPRCLSQGGVNYSLTGLKLFLSRWAGAVALHRAVPMLVLQKDKPSPSCVHSLSGTPREVIHRFCLNRDLSNGILWGVVLHCLSIWCMIAVQRVIFFFFNLFNLAHKSK